MVRENLACAFLICQVVAQSAMNKSKPAERALQNNALVGVLQERYNVGRQHLRLGDAEVDRLVSKPGAARTCGKHQRSSHWQRRYYRGPRAIQRELKGSCQNSSRHQQGQKAGE